MSFSPLFYVNSVFCMCMVCFCFFVDFNKIFYPKKSLGQCKMGAPVSSNASTENKCKIHNFFFRLAHCAPLFLNITNLQINKLIQTRFSLFMNKICNGLLSIDVQSHNTRRKNDLHVAMGHSDL